MGDVEKEPGASGGGGSTVSLFLCAAGAFPNARSPALRPVTAPQKNKRTAAIVVDTALKCHLNARDRFFFVQLLTSLKQKEKNSGDLFLAFSKNTR